MKQIYSKDSAIVITTKEVFMINHPSTIYTDDNVIVTIGKDDTTVKERLTVVELKSALDVVKVSYAANELKSELIKKLDIYLNEKIINDTSTISSIEGSMVILGIYSGITAS